MRTTVTLDSDVDALVKRQMRERGISFKQALNDAIRAGLGRRRDAQKRPTWPTYEMGLKPGIDLTKATQLAGELEDAELIRKMRADK